MIDLVTNCYLVDHVINTVQSVDDLCQPQAGRSADIRPVCITLASLDAF